MVGTLRVGCAMWANRSWLGRGLPATTATGAELNAYGAVLNAVEGNTTFYALPTRETAARWAAAVPDDFRFMFKFPRAVTHDRKLRDADDAVAEFFDAVEPCLDKMSPIAIQLPASFDSQRLAVLDAFLAGLPQDLRFAVEVRQLDFFDGGAIEHSLNDVLYRHGADRIVLDSRPVFGGPRVTPAEHEAFENKPRVPVRAVATNDRPVVRFIGQTNPDANPEYWQPWVETMVRWLNDGRSPTMFVHTPDNVDAIGLARRFYDEVRAQLPAIPALAPMPVSDTPALFD